MTTLEVIEPWCAMGATGALQVLDPPGGTVYLNRGRIAYASAMRWRPSR